MLVRQVQHHADRGMRQVVAVIHPDAGGVGAERDLVDLSGRDAECVGEAFADYCAGIGVRQSLGRTGVCWDNAVAETWFATMKNEMYHRYRFATRARARFTVAEYIEVFYNRIRLHSSLGYQTPATVLADYQTAAAA